MRSEMRDGCGARARSRKPLPGGFGHHVRRYYGRCAGCCRWTGTGARRVTPPRAASQETWPEAVKPRPRNLGQSRGGAPEGERADRKARARIAPMRRASSNCAFRRSASLRFYLEANTWDWLAQNSGAGASRERDRFSSPLAGEDRSRAARSGEGSGIPAAAGPHPARRFAARRPLPQGEGSVRALL